MIWSSYFFGLACFCVVLCLAEIIARKRNPFWLNELLIKPGKARLVPTAVLCHAAILGFFYIVHYAFVTSALLSALLTVPLIFSYKALERRRTILMQEQVDTLLLILSKSLSYDSSILNAFKEAEQRVEPPLKDELRKACFEISIGQNVDEVLRQFADDLKSEVISLAVNGIVVCRDTGGDLPRFLERLASVARTRSELKGKIDAATAQQKLTAIFVTTMPIAFITAALMLNPSYIAYYVSPNGIFAIVYMIASLGAGIFWLNRMTKVMPGATKC